MHPIPYGRQTITEEDIAAVSEALRDEFLTQGPRVAEFEKKFAEYVHAPFAVAVSNGTAALHLAAIAMHVVPGNKVITSPITFAASANCIRYCGGDVVFADIEPETFLLDIKKVRLLLEMHPKGSFQGIIPVDYAGLPVDLEAFRKLADEYGLWIIEDACHAPGAWFTDSKGEKCFSGSNKFTDAAIFSFHPVKHIACGEGGMVTTANEDTFSELMSYRTHGITKDPRKFIQQSPGPWYYEMQNLGYNYRLTDFQSALGLSQLKKANEGLARRKELAAKYTDAFRDSVVKVPRVPAGRDHAWHLYVIRVNNRAEVFSYLREKNIYAQVHYVPVHLMPYYKNYGFKEGDFPIAESFYDSCISIPMFPSLTDDEQNYVIRCVLEAAK
jgi:UDP-4-amino-4,6-dideoxy-N-acetyl-beta-L-altrosamine transaminase